VALLTALTAVGMAAPDTNLLLVEAARTRDMQKVQALLKDQVDVNVRGSDGGTALLWAVHWDDLHTADLLIRAGADVNATNEYRVAPLSVACTNRNPVLVKRLLDAGAQPDIASAAGETPMMTCARTGSADAVKALLARGADVNAVEPALKQSALMWAAAERHANVVRLLIERGADVRAATRHGFTPLHFAAREGDIEIARMLVAAGVDVDIVSKADPSLKGRGPAYDAMRSDGSTPLLVATVRGHATVARFLLEHGADPNVLTAGFTPLHWAASTWEGDISNPVFGFSDPMSGIPDRQAKLELVKALLAHGANPNARITRRMPQFAGGYTEPVGATAFFLASSVADVEVMRLLLSGGADPHLRTDSGTTPLMAAAGVNRKLAESPITEEQSLEAVRLLLELGADASDTSANGENALFGPAYRGWNKLVDLLAEKGADVNAVSKANLTPWLAASGLGDRFGGVLFNTETAALLEKLGADPKLGKPCQAQGKCR
jgi:ankyrin repeat protein